MILISIPVHENPEVILDQISNINKFAPHSKIILHPSRQFLEKEHTFIPILASMPGVLLNPSPIYTRSGMVLKCHISNFIHAKNIGVDFSHFALHSSNDMFVKNGVEDYIYSHGYGFSQLSLDCPSHRFAHWRPNFRSDRTYKKIMRAAGGEPTEFVSQVEGTFYPSDAFDEFVAYFLRFAWNEFPYIPGYSHGMNFNMVKIVDKALRSKLFGKYLKGYFYTKEEFYPPNFFSLRCSAPAPPYCFMNWQNDLKVTTSEVENIRNGLIHQEIYLDLFAVKRVSRSMEDPLRVMIRNLDN